jgi:hypothetical protein
MRSVFVLIDDLVESEQDIKHFGEAMPNRFVPETLNLTGVFP